MDAPFRTNFDAARDPLTARNALGILDGGPMANGTVKMRTSSGAGAPEDVTFANAILALSAVRQAFSANKNGTNQTGIVANTPTLVTYTTEEFDIGGYYDAANSKWTPPAGTVLINHKVQFTAANVVDQTFYFSMIYKNGNLWKQALITSSGATATAVEVSAIDRANGTDYYEAYAQGGAAAEGNKTISGVTSASWFQGTVL